MSGLFNVDQHSRCLGMYNAQAFQYSHPPARAERALAGERAQDLLGETERLSSGNVAHRPRSPARATLVKAYVRRRLSMQTCHDGLLEGATTEREPRSTAEPTMVRRSVAQHHGTYVLSSTEFRCVRLKLHASGKERATIARRSKPAAARAEQETQ
jgi:hypothetical protein